MSDIGWCGIHQDLHVQRETCVSFESDAAYIDRLIAAAAEHDRANEGRTEAAYIAQHRPY